MRGAFDVLWRLAILALPWQTRWFWGAELAGWPWEQGTISFYVSWVFLVTAIVAGHHGPLVPVRAACVAWRGSLRACSCGALRAVLGSQPYAILGAMTLMIFSFIATRFDPASLQAVGAWWVNVVLLAFFIRTVWKSGIAWASVATWFVISLIPQALLGIWQFVDQEVIASTLLGIASQLPETRGVSVIEMDGVRTLRAYGGFPHPTLFGGWLAIGILTSLKLATSMRNAWHLAFWAFVSALFSAALILTFARSAWIAAAVGVIWFVWAHRGRTMYVSTMCMIMVVLTVAVSQRHLILSRFDRTERLEAKSITSRVESFKTGLHLFRTHPWTGTGPNAELRALVIRDEIGRAPVPLEPPHNVYLLALVNFGIIGLAILFFFFVIPRFNRGIQFESWIPPLFAPLLILGLFDHYLWTLWPGQVLAALTILLAFGNITHAEAN